ncbi:OmpA family protein [Streptomyces sp. SBT349]|uniref:OmpA family protein n=1 Tax=Streptomyces sp. SBT349 TaxID=1580539 RepID=UPI00066B97B8|nr:OmpA family protein [Streptomyces sp. SBT349]
MRHVLHHPGRSALFVMTGTALVVLGSPVVASADEDPPAQQPPDYVAPEPPEIDPDAAGLMLGDGATLAEPRVVEVSLVWEDLGTGETGDGSPPPEEPATEGATGGETEDPGGQEPNGGGGGGEQREEVTGNTHKFTLQTDVIFGEGSDEITDESREALMDVATAIDEHQPTQVNIFGFTDDQGSYESGEELSDNRARNTHQVLLDLIEDPVGIQFNVRGYSEDYPLYDNETEDGREGNRRVEISWPTNEER